MALNALRQPAAPDEEPSYLVSVSDLMVGMLFIFIIILMAFALNFRVAQDEATQIESDLVGERDAVNAEKDRLARERDRLARERDQLAAERDRLAEQRDTLQRVTDRLLDDHRIRSEMLATVQSLLRERQVQVSLDPKAGVLRLPEELLFDSAKAVFRPEGRRALRELAAVLARTLPCYSRAPRLQQIDCPIAPQALLEAVLVEGHTDDVPINTPEFADNWDLASTRAINTYKALMAFQPSLGDLQNGSNEDLLGVSGYEAHRPVSPDPTPAGRRLNRRIDLRFLIAAPSQKEIAEIRRQVRRGRSP
jgi:flagellar motor protein MotB